MGAKMSCLCVCRDQKRVACGNFYTGILALSCWEDGIWKALSSVPGCESKNPPDETAHGRQKPESPRWTQNPGFNSIWSLNNMVLLGKKPPFHQARWHRVWVTLCVMIQCQLSRCRISKEPHPWVYLWGCFSRGLTLGRKTSSNYGWHHPVDWVSGLNKKRKGPECSSLSAS